MNKLLVGLISVAAVTSCGSGKAHHFNVDEVKEFVNASEKEVKELLESLKTLESSTDVDEAASAKKMVKHLEKALKSLEVVHKDVTLPEHHKEAKEHLNKAHKVAKKENAPETIKKLAPKVANAKNNANTAQAKGTAAKVVKPTTNAPAKIVKPKASADKKQPATDKTAKNNKASEQKAN